MLIKRILPIIISLQIKATIIKFNSSMNLTSMNQLKIAKIAEFKTSVANLTVIDYGVNTQFWGPIIKRKIINPERDEIFISEANLLIPKDIGRVVDTSLLKVNPKSVQYWMPYLTLAPFAAHSLIFAANSTGDVLIIGLGGATMNNFLHFYFPHINLTVIELEEGMVEVARKYFGLKEDDRQTVLTMDGLAYLTKNAKDEPSIRRQFDAIYIDACPPRYPQEEEVFCPAKSFINETVIENLYDSLLENGTMVIKLLVIAKNVTKKSQELMKPYQSRFKNCYLVPLPNIVNGVLICNKKRLKSELILSNTLEVWLKKFNEYIKEMNPEKLTWI